MSREVPFNENQKCDICDNIGAFDFMGDHICPNCIDKEANKKRNYTRFKDTEVARLLKAEKNNTDNIKALEVEIERIEHREKKLVMCISEDAKLILKLDTENKKLKETMKESFSRIKSSLEYRANYPMNPNLSVISDRAIEAIKLIIKEALKDME